MRGQVPAASGDAVREQDAYRFYARVYDRLYEPGARRLRMMGLGLFAPREDLSILDVGCGTGTQLALYQRSGCRLCGIDRSPAMLSVAQRKLGRTSDHIDVLARSAYRRNTMKSPSDPCVALCPPPAPDGDLPEGEAADRELALLARAVAHPARVRILRILAEREACVCGELVEALPLAQSTVSEHLRILKEAGLIRGEIAPPQVCYCLEPRGLRRLKALLGSL